MILPFLSLVAAAAPWTAPPAPPAILLGPGSTAPLFADEVPRVRLAAAAATARALRVALRFAVD
ncbi:MAG: hypothetical protein R2724_35100 [Bryobacterales bacterium]